MLRFKKVKILKNVLRHASKNLKKIDPFQNNEPTLNGSKQLIYFMII